MYLYFDNEHESKINDYADQLFTDLGDVRVCGKMVNDYANGMALCSLADLHKTIKRLEAIETAIKEVTGLVIAQN